MLFTIEDQDITGTASLLSDIPDLQPPVSSRAPDLQPASIVQGCWLSWLKGKHCTNPCFAREAHSLFLSAELHLFSWNLTMSASVSHTVIIGGHTLWASSFLYHPFWNFWAPFFFVIPASKNNSRIRDRMKFHSSKVLVPPWAPYGWQAALANKTLSSI